jgi:hypothetical protein
MRNLPPRDEWNLGFGMKPGPWLQDIPTSEGSSFWKRFFKELSTSFNAPFVSDWEKKSGLPWKEWGKL